MPRFSRYSSPWTGNPFFAGAFPPVVKGLLIAAAAVFFVQILFPPTLWLFGFIPSHAVGRLWLWQFFTYMFLHGNFGHIFFNLLTLWMFGRRLETTWGSRAFLRFFLVCGAGAAVVHLAATAIFRQPQSVMIGASGAVYAILLAYALRWGEDVVYLNFIFPMKIKYLVLIFGILDFVSSIGHIAGGRSTGIAHFTHLGGLLAAWLYLRFNAGGAFSAISRLRPRRRPRGPIYKPERSERRPNFDDDTWR